MTVRAAGRGDLAALVALDAAVFGPDAWSEATILRGLGDTLVAAGEDGLVGYAVAVRAGEVVDLERIAVRPESRRAGVARRLLGAALAAASGAERMLLEVRADNQEALALYRSAGFEAIHWRRGYYRDGADALVLQRQV